jgi:hypothetical protein
VQSDADLNLGCPQDIAQEEHFGAYLLVKKDWPLIQDIGKPAKRACFLPSTEHITTSLISIANCDLCTWRCTWFSQFRMKLGQCTTTEEIEILLKGKVKRWHKLKDTTISQGRAEGEMVDEGVDIQAEGRKLMEFPHSGLFDDDNILMLEMKTVRPKQKSHEQLCSHIYRGTAETKVLACL